MDLTLAFGDLMMERGKVSVDIPGICNQIYSVSSELFLEAK